MKKHLVDIIGIILIVLSLVFVAQRVIALDVNFAELLTPINVAMVIVMPFLSVTVIFSNSYCWRMVLALFSKRDIPVGETFSAYARANVMKYLPGNVGHYAGRQLFGAKLGVKQIQLATASILENIYVAVAMVLCAFAFSASTVIRELQSRFSGGVGGYVWLVVIGVVAIIMLVLATIVFRKNKYVISVLELLRSFRFWRVMIMSILLCSFGSAILVMEYVVLLGQYVSIDFPLMLMLVSANFVAMLVGFVTPGVPGGIGVREAVLMTILSPFFSGDVVILAAITHRIIMILGDVVAVTVSGLFITKNVASVDSV